jgi:hypothetical protein
MAELPFIGKNGPLSSHDKGRFVCCPGTRMLLMDIYPIPVPVSLSVVALIIASAIGLSLRRDARQQAARPVKQS